MTDYIDIGLVVVKAIIILHAPLVLASMVTWFERKGSALMQNRIGANRAAIPFPFFGLVDIVWARFDLAGVVNTLICDPVKAITKEDFVPKGTSQFMHSLAPFMGVFPVLISFAVIPFGPPIRLENRTITLQLADLNVGVLYVFAMGSLAVYGTMLAGWVSNNKFSLLGSLRASAQMISYEITLGLSIVGLLVIYGSLDLNEIIAAQSGTNFGFLPRWGIFLFFPFNFVAFLLFFISMMAETKRNPFDMPESESDLVAGYFTEYSGMKFLLFWLGEFAEIVVAATMVTVLFFGGWQLPYLDLAQFPIWGGPIGAAVFGVKVTFFCMLQVIIRWTVPRFRYDQVMHLCWKIMLPIALVNLVLTVGAVLYVQDLGM